MNKNYEKYFIKPSIKNAAKRTKKRVEIIRKDVVIPDRLKQIAINKTYCVRTFGCQANERDGEIISGILEEIGYKFESNPEKADLVILNTCAVRENAEEKVFGTMGGLKKIKNDNPDFIFGICGCMVQQDDIVEKILKKYPQVDLIFGTHNINNIPALIDNAYFDKARVVEVYSKEGEVYENLPSKRENNLKAWVNIMYGCDKFCTYCIVPYTRGKERSRLMEDILQEVNDLKKSGYKEITLLGQNVNAYGNDLNLGYNFADLLNEVAKTNIDRIRFTTSHPWNFTKEMINAIANNKNIMPYVHLPLQSGDDDILRKMARRYTIKEYVDLYKEIRNKIEGVCITTDIIVGFPGETLEQFENTLKIVDELKYDGAFTFIYSPRSGTPAAKMKDDVSNKEKHERFNRLLDIVNKHALDRNKEYEGKILKVLVEGPSKRNPNIFSGYSENNKLVNFVGNPNMISKIVKVKIKKAKSFTLEGEAIG
ncbi:MAG: tRNA (N6-isopentenyl adenosine(37)-C2)-methylthiotransferase MiaB [Bacilli bacterium]|nr:tRNA (N6-isopentenyl adenosine(37)-C2)-methylthiotransferase MiaB [Bacilli bacterium]